MIIIFPLPPLHLPPHFFLYEIKACLFPPPHKRWQAQVLLILLYFWHPQSLLNLFSFLLRSILAKEDGAFVSVDMLSRTSAIDF